MDVISSVAFGFGSQVFDSADSIVAKMFKKMAFKISPLTMLNYVVQLYFPIMGKIFPLRFVDKEAEDFFSKLVHMAVKHRESTGEKRDDFIQLMIETKNGQMQAEREKEEMDVHEKGVQKNLLQIDDKIIVANCVLFIVAGFDTINSALIFGAYALALNKDIQDKLRQELQKAIETNAGELSYDIITQHEYLDKITNETLRMYSPIVRTERTVMKDYHIPNSNVVIPKDTLVVISVYHTQHNEKYFPAPEVFDPERFSQENKANRHPYAFMPFGYGLRNCIANRFALTETKTLIANLVLNFEMETCAKTQIPMEFAMASTLKPAMGMWLNLKPITRQ